MVVLSVKPQGVWEPGRCLRPRLFALAKRALDTRRAIPRCIPGALRLCSVGYRALRPKGVVPVRVHDLTLYVDASDEFIATELLAYGRYETAETDVFRRLLRPGMVVVDVGAHVGYYALISAGLVGPEGAVYAFEPDPHNFALLTANVEVNRAPNMVCVPKAVSSRSGRATLFLDRHNHGAHTLVEANLETEADGRAEVETVSLDEFFRGRRVDLIKVDAQGAEGLVIDGARGLLQHHGPTILMEFWPGGLRRMGTDPGALLATLRGHGYLIRVVEEGLGAVADAASAVVALAERRRYVNLLLQRPGTQGEQR